MRETVQETRTQEVILLSNFHVPLEILLRVSCSCQTIPSHKESPLCARISSFSCMTSVFCWYTSIGEDLGRIFFFFQTIKWSGWIFVGVCQPAQIFTSLSNLPYQLIWPYVITKQNKTSLLILMKIIWNQEIKNRKSLHFDNLLFSFYCSLLMCVKCYQYGV